MRTTTLDGWTVNLSDSGYLLEGPQRGCVAHMWRSCQTIVGHQPAGVIFVTWSRCRRMVNRTLSEVRGESGDRCLEECLETDVWRSVWRQMSGGVSGDRCLEESLETDVWRTLTHTSRSKLSANHSV